MVVSPGMNRAVILCGGRGTRLRPLTDTTPKPLIQIGDRPLVAHTVTALARAGHTNITLALNYKPEAFRGLLGDGLKFGANLSYFVEPTPLGTAGCLPHIFPATPNMSIIVCNGDIITDLSWRDFVASHENSGADISVATYKHTINVEFGVATGRGHIAEKPVLQVPVVAGAYILKPEIIKSVNPEGDNMPDVINRFVDDPDHQELINVWNIPGFWIDVGRPADLERALGSTFN